MRIRADRQKEMEMLRYNEAKGFYSFSRPLWARSITVRIMTDDRAAAEKALPVITDKLDRIERGREKISKRIIEDMQPLSDYQTEDISSSLYISKLRAEIYRDGDIEIIFGIKSRLSFKVEFFYEAELHSDNSFEI